VDVNKSLTIRSSSGNPADTIVHSANPDDHVFEITANYVNISGFTMEGNGIYVGGVGIIHLRDVGYCNISNNKISNSGKSIELDYSNTNVIKNNIIFNTQYSISLSYSDNNKITNNSITSNIVYAISLWYSSSNNVIVNNNISSNIGVGIGLCDVSNNNLVMKNNIVSIQGSTGDGIWVRRSGNNAITVNNIASNGGDGIYLEDSINNEITNNNIASNNQRGIYLKSSNDNNIYLNNFVNNSNNIYSYESANFWNSPEKMTYIYNGSQYTNYMGNCWSDYTGTDPDGDGIGDTPYPINSDNDSYPLMEWFENYTGMSRSPWPMFQHDPQHTGRSPYVGPQTPNIKWIFNGVREAIHGPSVADDGTIYLAASKLYAISPEGELKWQHQAGGVNAPVVRDGMVYVVAYGGLAHGGLFAFDSEGILKWNKTFAYLYMAVNPTLRSNGKLYYVAGCVLPDGLIHCCLIALD
ncbi:MAG: right-handed parallel beta-helix repeat-containing protein, partial [Methanophagales archaeon]|nr:right-handed parallel beta-helix repeat-containing protein [Methanophagales archaeon]